MHLIMTLLRGSYYNKVCVQVLSYNYVMDDLDS